jgi:SAM-dependent methyltransferase
MNTMNRRVNLTQVTPTKILAALASWLNPRFMACRTVALIERMRGLDFMQVIQPEEVGLDPECSFKSSPSGDKYLINMLRDFHVTTGDRILDIGCGKGSAMRVMQRFPFAAIDGVEISPEIAAIAAKNMTRLHADRSIVFCCDATSFDSYDHYNMLYLYNPFPASVMARVVDAIVDSAGRKDREIVILYNNPTCHDVLVHGSPFREMGVYPDQWGHGIHIYSNRFAGNSRLSANRRLRRVSSQSRMEET